MPSSKPAASIVVATVPVLVSFSSIVGTTSLLVLHILIVGITYHWMHVRIAPFSNNILPKQRRLCCQTQTTHFLPFKGRIPTMESTLAVLVSHICDGDHVWKMCKFHALGTTTFRYFLRTPTAFSCNNNACATLYDMLTSVPINVARYYGVMKRDMAGARKT
jgi:hypothetical protein